MNKYYIGLSKWGGKSTDTDIFEVYIYESEEDASSPHGKELIHKTFYSEDEADEYLANLPEKKYSNAYYLMYANELNGSNLYEYKEDYVVVGKKKVRSRGEKEEVADSPEAEEDDPISTDKTPPGETGDLPIPGEGLDSFFYRDAINAVRKATVGLQTAIDHFERDIPQSTFDELVDDLEGLRSKLEEIVKDTEQYLDPTEYEG